MKIFKRLQGKFERFVSRKPNTLSPLDMLKEPHRSKQANLYGMLMMRGDLDVLEQVLECNSSYFRAIFVLDGTENAEVSRKILEKFANVEKIFYDSELPAEYNRPPRDGARQILLNAIQEKYGYDGYIFILHSDEMFFDYPPTLLATAMARYRFDLASVRNVHFFLHTSMKDGYYYDSDISVVSQIPYACFPGYPEYRCFKNKAGLHYLPNEHSKVHPHGLSHAVSTVFPIRHYLYRTPEQMELSSVDRKSRGWQGYGNDWMEVETERFVDCLPKYKFAKYIPVGARIINGETGEIESK